MLNECKKYNCDVITINVLENRIEELENQVKGLWKSMESQNDINKSISKILEAIK